MSGISQYELRLAEMRGRYSKATPGPWFVKSAPGGGYAIVTESVIGPSTDTVAITSWSGREHADARFIAMARTDLPRLVDTVFSLLVLHRPVLEAVHESGSEYSCSSCGTHYPCKTASVIAETLSYSTADKNEDVKQ